MGNGLPIEPARAFITDRADIADVIADERGGIGSEMGYKQMAAIDPVMHDLPALLGNYIARPLDGYPGTVRHGYFKYVTKQATCPTQRR